MITRRFLLTSAGLLTGTALLPQKALSQPNPRREVLPIWPDRPPGGGGPSGPVRISRSGAVSNIAIPSIEVHRPARPNGAAMLIAAGGGYKRIERAKEALPAARWLTARGITAVILTYRLPVEGWNAGPLAPLQDAQRALRMIRARAAEAAIDPNRIGVLGFSAGGHLMGMAATRPDFRSSRAADPVDRLSARSEAMVLAYPVITLLPPFDDTSTRRSLIGLHPSARASAEWSVQTHVGAGCPPAFLVQAADDPISNPQNTAILQRACEAAGVPVKRILLASGGHGFGMGRPGTASAHWPMLLDGWLRGRGFL